MSKQHSPQVNKEGKKFLFYRFGKPVYEGDETHQHMEIVRKQFGGSEIEAAKATIKQIDKLLNK